MEKSNSEKNKNIGSRFIKGRKQDAIAEIEGWIAENRGDTTKAAASRMTSQPAKNVTEQKMLDSKLFDMSKQRFNFILQCQWQRKLFLEKQRKKTTVMRDLLRNVDVTIFSENPFSTSKTKRRQGTVINNDRKKSAQTGSRIKASTTIPGMRRSPGLKSVDATFVTQRAKFLPSISESKKSRSERASDDSPADVAFSNFNPKVAADSDSIVQSAWPMSDVRYLRLSEALCDNYPKVQHLRSNAKNAFMASTTAY
ncbi:unnamed protein product [Clavelina lepadiformis]|uniref:Uncharacterized protein n=1 Tax=Clavelina lepadiformis TaxID=159417 RepID=A0ABP0G1D2_CLALP